MTVKALNPKQEKFCHAYIETSNATEAYRQAGYGPNATEKTQTENACRLLANSNVLARINALRAGHQKRHEITVDSLTAELNTDREMARKLEQPATAITATMGQAKLHGLLTEKVDLNASLSIHEILNRRNDANG